MTSEERFKLRRMLVEQLAINADLLLTALDPLKTPDERYAAIVMAEQGKENSDRIKALLA